jgi:tetratricopeptide (TPR) repeat protein
MRQVEPQLTTRVQSAVDEGRWSDALEALAAAGDDAHTPELLELWAQAAYGRGDFEASIGAWEDQHRLLLDTGDAVGAARAAAMVAMFLMIDTGLMSPVRGWVRRAEELLEGTAESPTHALIAAVRAYERFMCGDPAEARVQADRAVELGRRLDVRAAEVIGRTAGARITILEGHVDAGVDELEAIGVLLMSGEVDSLTTGMMLCELVCAARGLARHDMAAEWTDAMDRWRPRAAFGGLHGRCRVHRAEILRVSGPCDVAEAEALGACDDLRPWMRREFGWPLAELGNIRLRRGDLDGAEEAFRAAHEHVWNPQPGLALVHLARGDVAGARALIDAAIAQPFRAPSKELPPASDLTLAPLLEAQVEIAVAGCDLATAEAASAGLRKIADRYGGPWLHASASLAEARTALQAGDLEASAAAGTAAIGAWADLGAPYETALARMVLADAHLRAGNASSARIEWEAAANTFEAFGARWWALVARARLDDHRVEDHRVEEHEAVVGPTERPGADRPDPEPAVFRLDGDTRVVSFAGRSVTVRDLKGYRYLARLLASPGRELHVLDMVAVEQGTLPTGDAAFVGEADLEIIGGGRGLPALDAQARDAYRRRLAEVEDDLEDARRCNDPARAELAEHDRGYLVAELARAVGLGGRLTAVGSDAERARTAVARTLRYAIDHLSERHSTLAAHLDNCVRTGTYCSYRPDPLVRVEWSF